MKDIRLILLEQTDVEETRQACLHYLGDKFQKYDEQLKITSFWKTDIGKILSYGIHEHSNALCMLQTSCSLIKIGIEKGTLTNTELLEYIDKIKAKGKTCAESIDYIYEQIKKL